jgi:hypothetical protein
MTSVNRSAGRSQLAPEPGERHENLRHDCRLSRHALFVRAKQMQDRTLRRSLRARRMDKATSPPQDTMQPDRLPL